MTARHGTLYMYNKYACRCHDCRDAARDRYHTFGSPGSPDTATREQRRSCLICKVPLNVHPFKACWRELQ